MIGWVIFCLITIGFVAYGWGGISASIGAIISVALVVCGALFLIGPILKLAEEELQKSIKFLERKLGR